MISTEMFPFESFGVRLEHTDEKKICWFKDDYDLQKYLERYKLDKRTTKIDYRDGEPVKSGKKHKNSVESGTGKSTSRSAGGSKRSTKKLDTSGTSSRNRKPKSK
jgi:activator of HSP90 ATPase